MQKRIIAIVLCLIFATYTISFAAKTSSTNQDYSTTGSPTLFGLTLSELTCTSCVQATGVNWSDMTKQNQSVNWGQGIQTAQSWNAAGIGAGLLKLLDGYGVNWVAIQAAATLSGTATYTWPTTDGTAGQVLTTDGSKTLSFATPSAPLSSWASKSQGTTYQAATDGFVTGYATLSGGQDITLYTDSSATPTTVRSQSYMNGATAVMSVSSMVKKNDYYKVTSGGSSFSCYFIPMGS